VPTFDSALPFKPSSGVHNLREIKPSAIFREHENSVDCIATDQTNDHTFATGSHDKTIKLWDIIKEKYVNTLTGHTQGVWCVNYNPLGN